MKTKLLLTPCCLALAIMILLMVDSSSVKGRQPGDKTGKQLNDDRPVAILTRYKVKEGFQQEFRRVLNGYVLNALASNDNVMAEAYFEQDTPSVFWVIERWSSKIALDRATTSIQFKVIQLLVLTALSEPARTIYVRDLEPLSKEAWRRRPAKADKPLTIMLFVDAKGGTEDHFKDVYHTAMPQFRSEPGVINYQLSQFEDDLTKFVTYEKFRNEDAFQYHLNFPPIQPVIQYLNTSIKRQPFQDGLHRLIELPFLNK